MGGARASIGQHLVRGADFLELCLGGAAALAGGLLVGVHAQAQVLVGAADRGAVGVAGNTQHGVEIAHTHRAVGGGALVACVTRPVCWCTVVRRDTDGRATGELRWYRAVGGRKVWRRRAYTGVAAAGSVGSCA